MGLRDIIPKVSSGWNFDCQTIQKGDVFVELLQFGEIRYRRISQHINRNFSIEVTRLLNVQPQQLRPNPNVYLLLHLTKNPPPETLSRRGIRKKSVIRIGFEPMTTSLEG